MTLSFTHDAERLVVSADTYIAVVESTGAGFERSPYLSVHDANGDRWLALSLLASVHTVGGADETLSVGPVAVEHGAAAGGGGELRIHVVAWSSHWASRTTTVAFGPESLDLTVQVEGTGDLTDVTLLGGDGVFVGRPGGTFRSRVDARSLFVPAPGEPVAFVRPTSSAAALGVVGDADPGRLNGIFSPPPLVLGFAREAEADLFREAAGSWLGLSVRAAVETLTFTQLRWEPLDGGGLVRLAYEGHTRVDGGWRSPTVVLRPATSALATVDDHRADLVAHGFAESSTAGPSGPAPSGPASSGPAPSGPASSGPAPSASRDAPAWWRQPIFCGWGAQCATVIAEARRADPAFSPEHAEHVDPTLKLTAEVAVRAASELSRQDVYDGYLARLADLGLEPGTIVVDDRWQAAYGTATVDTEKWPDLEGWIVERHAEGRRVLLWWKAWDPQGLPADECILDGAGRALAVDPASPAYRSRLRRTMSALLGPDGLDADGLKVDFTQASPSGRSLRSAGTTWGIAALHLLLREISDASKAAKPDALVIAHAVHPSFGDVSDMVRLNDVSRRDASGALVPVVQQMRLRHEIATRALPDHLVDTDQWPMPTKADWLAYASVQPSLGVPALYYLDSIERTGEPIADDELRQVAASWREYRRAEGL